MTSFPFLLFFKKRNRIQDLTDTDNNINKYNIKNLVNANILKLFSELPTAEMENTQVLAG